MSDLLSRALKTDKKESKPFPHSVQILAWGEILTTFTKILSCVKWLFDQGRVESSVAYTLSYYLIGKLSISEFRAPKFSDVTQYKKICILSTSDKT